MEDNLKELDLIKRINEGDEKAFELLVKKNYKKVFAMIYAYIPNRDEALDLTQDVFIKIKKNITKLQGISSFSSWLYTVVHNHCIDYFRKNKYKFKVEYIDKINYLNKEDEKIDYVKPKIKTPETSLIERELGFTIFKALNKLSKKHREVLLLRIIDGMDYEEIAKTCKINVGTVMSRLFYARKAIKEYLEKYYFKKIEQKG